MGGHLGACAGAERGAGRAFFCLGGFRGVYWGSRRCLFARRGLWGGGCAQGNSGGGALCRRGGCLVGGGVPPHRRRSWHQGRRCQWEGVRSRWMRVGGPTVWFAFEPWRRFAPGPGWRSMSSVGSIASVVSFEEPVKIFFAEFVHPSVKRFAVGLSFCEAQDQAEAFAWSWASQN